MRYGPLRCGKCWCDSNGITYDRDCREHGNQPAPAPPVPADEGLHGETVLAERNGQRIVLTASGVVIGQEMHPGFGWGLPANSGAVCVSLVSEALSSAGKMLQRALAARAPQEAGAERPHSIEQIRDVWLANRSADGSDWEAALGAVYDLGRLTATPPAAPAVEQGADDGRLVQAIKATRMLLANRFGRGENTVAIAEVDEMLGETLRAVGLTAPPLAPQGSVEGAAARKKVRE